MCTTTYCTCGESVILGIDFSITASNSMCEALTVLPQVYMKICHLLQLPQGLPSNSPKTCPVPPARYFGSVRNDHSWHLRTRWKKGDGSASYLQDCTCLSTLNDAGKGVGLLQSEQKLKEKFIPQEQKLPVHVCQRTPVLWWEPAPGEWTSFSWGWVKHSVLSSY